jgi:hypothetical protein
MPDTRPSPTPSLVDRLARVAYAFLVMNCSAVAGLFSALTGRNIWR